MKLPYAYKAQLHPRIVRDTLLNAEHELTSGKALAFRHYGFERQHWDVFAKALTEHAIENPALRTRGGRGREWWVVEGPIKTPSGVWPLVKSVWMIKADGLPHLITAELILRLRRDFVAEEGWDVPLTFPLAA